MIAQTIQELFQNEAPINKTEIAKLFRFFYDQKPLFELEHWVEIINAYGIQKQVDSIFAFFEKFSYEGNLTIPFNEILGSFSKPLEEFISLGGKLLSILDNASKDLSSDERFKTIIAISDELTEIKKLPRDIVEKLLNNSIKAIENIANAIFNITDQTKLIIAENTEPTIMKSIHIVCDFIKNNTISVDAYMQLYNTYFAMYSELITKVHVYVPDFSALKEAVYNINQTILNIYNENLAMSIYKNVSNLAIQAYQTHFNFLYATYNETFDCVINLYNAFISQIESLNISGKIKEFFTIGDAKGANYRSFLEAIIECLADIEAHWENYTAVFPTQFPIEYREHFRMVINYLLAIKDHGINVTELLTNFVTSDPIQTEHIINALSATLFNQSASIMDIYQALDTEFGIKENIENFKQLMKMCYQELMVEVKNITLEVVQEINDNMNSTREVLDQVRFVIQQVKQQINYYNELRKLVFPKDTTLLNAYVKMLELAGLSQEQIENAKIAIKQVTQQFTQFGDRNIDISQFTFLTNYADMIKQYEEYIKMYTNAYMNYTNNLNDFQFLISSETLGQIRELVVNTCDSIYSVVNATLYKKSDVINAAKNVVAVMNKNIDFINQYFTRFFETAQFENITCEIPYIPEFPEFEFQDSSFFFNISEIKNIQAIISQFNPNITSEEIDAYIMQIKETVIPFILQINETVYNISQETILVSPEFVEYIENFEVKFNEINENLKMLLEADISQIIDQYVAEIVKNATQILDNTMTDQLCEKIGMTRESIHKVLGEVIYYYENKVKPQLENYTEKFPEMIQTVESIMVILNKARDELSESQPISKFISNMFLNGSALDLNQFIEPYVDQIKATLAEYILIIKPYITKYFELVQPPLANVIASLKTVNRSIFADVLEKCCGDFIRHYIEEIGKQYLNKTIDTNKTLLELFFNATGEIYNFVEQSMPTNQEEAIKFIEQLREMIGVYVPFFNTSLDDYGTIIHESQLNATKQLMEILTRQKEFHLAFIDELTQNLSTIVIKDAYMQMVETPYIKVHSTIANLNSLTVFNVFTLAEAIVFGEVMLPPPSQRKALDQTSVLAPYLDMFKSYVEKIGDQSITIDDVLPEGAYEAIVNATNEYNQVIDYYYNNTVGVAVDYVQLGISYANNYTEMITGYNVTGAVNYFIQLNTTEKVDTFYEAVETKTKEALVQLNESEYVQENIIIPAKEYISIIKPYTEMPVLNAISNITETDLTNVSKSSAIVFDKIVKGERIQVDEIAAIFSNITKLILTPEPTPEPTPTSNKGNTPPAGDDQGSSNILGMPKNTFIYVCVAVVAFIVIIVIVVVVLVIKKRNNDDDDDDEYADQSSEVVSETLL